MISNQQGGSGSLANRSPGTSARVVVTRRLLRRFARFDQLSHGTRVS